MLEYWNTGQLYLTLKVKLWRPLVWFGTPGWEPLNQCTADVLQSLHFFFLQPVLIQVEQNTLVQMLLLYLYLISYQWEVCTTRCFPMDFEKNKGVFVKIYFSQGIQKIEYCVSFCRCLITKHLIKSFHSDGIEEVCFCKRGCFLYLMCRSVSSSVNC